MNELATVEAPEAQVMQHPVIDATPMDMIDRAIQSGADVTVLERLMALHERWEAGRARAEFSAARVVAMSEMPPIPMTGLNKHTGKKYSTIDDIRETTRPVLAKHGMTLSHRTKVEGEKLIVTAVLAHSNGQEDMNELPLPFDGGQQRNAVQAIGSSQTYGERYTASALLGLSRGDQDDDGVAAGKVAINDDQLAALQAKIAETGANEAKLCEHFGVNALKDLPRAKYGVADAMLDQKKGKANG